QRGEQLRQVGVEELHRCWWAEINRFRQGLSGQRGRRIPDSNRGVACLASHAVFRWRSVQAHTTMRRRYSGRGTRHMASLSLSGIVKRYGNNEPTLKGIDLEIADGEFLVLVGPSGCGKSTLLRIIAGLESSSSGELRIGERVVNTVPPKERDIAMVFQSYALYPHMTVRRNMSFGLEVRKTPRAEIDKLVNDAARMLGLETQ